MSEPRYKLTVEQMDLGSCLHTALRKACDSEPTSLAYNLIHLNSMSAVWASWLDAFGQAIAERGAALDPPLPLFRVNVLDACRRATEVACGWGQADRNCLRLVFWSFTQDDWFGMLAYALEEEEVEEEDAASTVESAT